MSALTSCRKTLRPAFVNVCFHDVFDIATTARTDITAQEVIDYAEGQGMAFKSASHDEAEWRQVVATLTCTH